jgi:hypothetical protein
MKGQTAIEYLMTYGWAILIILIVAGVLAYYGIFAPAGFLTPTARGFGQVQVLSPWTLTANGDLTLRVENRVGEQINVTTIYATKGGSSSSCSISPEVTIDSGSNQIISGCALGSSIGGNAGDTYTVTLTIQYELTSNPGTYFNSTGTITGTY